MKKRGPAAEEKRFSIKTSSDSHSHTHTKKDTHRQD